MELLVLKALEARHADFVECAAGHAHDQFPIARMVSNRVEATWITLPEAWYACW
jgi:hypothetical protein